MLMAISSKPSPEPYVYHAIRKEECDLKWLKGNKIPQKVKAEKHHHHQKHTCVCMVSTASEAKIE